MIKTTSKYFLLITLVFFTLNSSAQSSDSVTKKPIVKFSFTTSLGISNGRNTAGMWHKANVSVGTSLQFGVRVAKNFWINSGVNYDFYRYRSAPLMHSDSVYHFYGLNPKIQ